MSAVPSSAPLLSSSPARMSSNLALTSRAILLRIINLKYASYAFGLYSTTLRDTVTHTSLGLPFKQPRYLLVMTPLGPSRAILFVRRKRPLVDPSSTPRGVFMLFHQSSPVRTSKSSY